MEVGRAGGKRECGREGGRAALLVNIEGGSKDGGKFGYSDAEKEGWRDEATQGGGRKVDGRMEGLGGKRKRDGRMVGLRGKRRRERFRGRAGQRGREGAM